MSEPRAEDSRPLISVVIETFNSTAESAIQLRDVLDRLDEQTHGRGNIEIIAVLDQANDELAGFLRDEYPDVQTVSTADATYYGMKNRGMRSAQGDIIALLDSDTLPVKNWVEEIASCISAGADLVAGSVRYPTGAPFGRTFALFNYGHIRNGEDGEVDTFNVSNAAMRKELLEEHPFDRRLRRSGGGTLLGRELKSLGYKLVYNPNLRVTHNHPGLRTHIATRLRTGYEVINICQLDDERVLPETKYLRLGVLAPFVLSARRALSDFRSIIWNGRDLDIRIHEMPFFLAIAVVVRAVEAVTGVITVIRPGYLAKRYGW